MVRNRFKTAAAIAVLTLAAGVLPAQAATALTASPTQGRTVTPAGLTAPVRQRSTVPGPVTRLIALRGYDDGLVSVDLIWDAPAIAGTRPGSDADLHTVLYTVSFSVDGGEQIILPETDSSDAYARLSGLRAGATYVFGIQASNELGVLGPVTTVRYLAE